MSHFVIVDVFTQGRYTGNPLAVFLNSEQYSAEQMQTLARELNFSESTFLLPQNDDGSYPVRIFTPVAELPFAGHPTLGSAFVIQQLLEKKPVSEIRLALPVGRIPVAISYSETRPSILTMRQNEPTFGECYPPHRIAKALGLEEDQIDAYTPIQIVSTGLPFLIVPLRTRKAVQHVRFLLDHFTQIPGMDPTTNVLVFAQEGEEEGHDLHVRVFVPELGISEDPATGSANGCLCAYLLRYTQQEMEEGESSVERRWIAEQGYEIGRQALLYLSGSRNGDRYTIYVGGRVEWVANATLCEPFPD